MVSDSMQKVFGEAMRTEEEVRARKAVLHETLAGLYGKGAPYAEERLMARIDEDEWVLNDKGGE